MREHFEQALRDGITFVVECDTPELSVAFWNEYIAGTTSHAKPHKHMTRACDYRFDNRRFQGYNYHSDSDYRLEANNPYYHIQEFMSAADILIPPPVDTTDFDMTTIM